MCKNEHSPWWLKTIATANHLHTTNKFSGMLPTSAGFLKNKSFSGSASSNGYAGLGFYVQSYWYRNALSYV
jgi:hypothetical protein